MCKQCELNPVYEFTNRRKLCKNCFMNYFLNKFLFTIRKFKMVKTGDIVGYKKTNDLKGIVLENLLVFLNKKYGTELVKLPNKKWELPAGFSQPQQPNRKLKINKIAIDSSLDSEANEIIYSIIQGKNSDLEKSLPVEKKIIKPLYLFLDEEILLYAKIKNLKFKERKDNENKIQKFINEFEKKHPEVKRATVNSLLELYK
jgi:hypothetical protein